MTKKGKMVISHGTELPNEKVITSLEKVDSYKYLGVLEADEVMVNEMKVNVKKEYYFRVRKKLETKWIIVGMFSKLLTLGQDQFWGILQHS